MKRKLHFLTNSLSNASPKIFLVLCLMTVFLLQMQTGFAQQQKPTIAPTNGETHDYNGADAPIPCALCVPDNWIKGKGTPDTANKDEVATGWPGHATTGNGAKWVDDSDNVTPLPLPPNGHDHWVVIRDIGNKSLEESVFTNINNLVVGREYEVVVYSITAITGEEPTPGVHNYYGHEYAEEFFYEVKESPTGNVIVRHKSIQKESKRKWQTQRARFKASQTTAYLGFYPGYTIPTTGTPPSINFQPIGLSVSLNAINEVPLAKDDEKVTSGSPVVFKVVDEAGSYTPSGGTGLTSDITAESGQGVQLKSVDLDPSTPVEEHVRMTSQGSWGYDKNTGKVTFTPSPNFTGDVASINYTVKDAYELDGNVVPATSNVATLKVLIDSDGVVKKKGFRPIFQKHLC